MDYSLCYKPHIHSILEEKLTNCFLKNDDSSIRNESLSAVIQKIYQEFSIERKVLVMSQSNGTEILPILSDLQAVHFNENRLKHYLAMSTSNRDNADKGFSAKAHTMSLDVAPAGSSSIKKVQKAKKKTPPKTNTGKLSITISDESFNDSASIQINESTLTMTDTNTSDSIDSTKNEYMTLTLNELMVPLVWKKDSSLKKLSNFNACFYLTFEYGGFYERSEPFLLNGPPSILSFNHIKLKNVASNAVVLVTLHCCTMVTVQPNQMLNNLKVQIRKYKSDMEKEEMEMTLNNINPEAVPEHTLLLYVNTWEAALIPLFSPMAQFKLKVANMLANKRCDASFSFEKRGAVFESSELAKYLSSWDVCYMNFNILPNKLCDLMEGCRFEPVFTHENPEVEYFLEYCNEEIVVYKSTDKFYTPPVILINLNQDYEYKVDEQTKSIKLTQLYEQVKMVELSDMLLEPGTSGSNHKKTGSCTDLFFNVSELKKETDGVFNEEVKKEQLSKTLQFACKEYLDAFVDFLNKYKEYTVRYGEYLIRGNIRVTCPGTAKCLDMFKKCSNEIFERL